MNFVVAQCFNFWFGFRLAEGIQRLGYKCVPSIMSLTKWYLVSRLLYPSPETLLIISRLCTNISQKPSSDKLEKKKEKSVESGCVTLLGTDNSVSFLPLVDANKLANRRGLRLLKVSDFDKRRQSPVYQLMTGAQYLKEDIEAKKAKAKKSDIKNEKIISFSNRISTHDINNKVRQMQKWLQKNHEVRVTISGSESDEALSEAVYKEIEKALVEARITQKHHKGSDIKFHVLPQKVK